jgi:phospholipid/cholesterol/gamma-HCH transport system permease protein
MSLAEQIAQIGAGVAARVEGLGAFTRFAGRSAAESATRFTRWCRWRLIGPQLYAIGVATIPVVAVTGAFIGMVLAIETFQQFQALGQESRLGGVINISVTKQIGPVLAAVMVAGRVGCALAAELGTMRVTEQLDALRAMAADPIVYLVIPRVVACIVMTPILTVYSDVLGVWGGWLITVGLSGVSEYEYWQFTAYYVDWWEPTSGLIKSVFFGASIGFVACYKGFTCRPGAEGVGRAATEAFVVSFLAIIVINLVLAKLLNDIGAIFLGADETSPLG